MAYFVKIGPIPSNLGGVGARGYHIYRRGNRVCTVWGAIEVRPGRQFYWVHTTQEKSFRCSTPAAAERLRMELVAVRETDYQRLPRGTYILRHRGSALSTVRR